MRGPRVRSSKGTDTGAFVLQELLYYGTVLQLLPVPYSYMGAIYRYYSIPVA